MVRSALVPELAAGVSELMRRVLNVFFSEKGHSFERGCILDCWGAKFVLRANFAGFLADEKAHKEILETKGASGTKPCINCKHIAQFLDLPAGSSGYLQFHLGY